MPADVPVEIQSLPGITRPELRVSGQALVYVRIKPAGQTGVDVSVSATSPSEVSRRAVDGTSVSADGGRVDISAPSTPAGARVHIHVAMPKGALHWGEDIGLDAKYLESSGPPTHGGLRVYGDLDELAVRVRSGTVDVPGTVGTLFVQKVAGFTSIGNVTGSATLSSRDSGRIDRVGGDCTVVSDLGTTRLGWVGGDLRAFAGTGGTVEAEAVRGRCSGDPGDGRIAVRVTSQRADHGFQVGGNATVERRLPLAMLTDPGARWKEGLNPTPETIAAFRRLEQATRGSTPWATAGRAVQGVLEVRTGTGAPRILKPHPVGGRGQVTDKDKATKKGYGPPGKRG